jgi:hypothetical protein
MADVTIDNGKLNTMRQNPDMVKKFPFLLASVTTKSGCCGKGQTMLPDYDGMRRAIVQLSPEKKVELKQTLGAEKLTVDFREGGRVRSVVL